MAGVVYSHKSPWTCRTRVLIIQLASLRVLGGVMLGGVTPLMASLCRFCTYIIKNPQLKPGANSSLKETGMKRSYPNLPDVEAIKKAA